MTRVARFALLSLAVAASFAGVGCQRPVEALAFSNESVDFGLNTRPFFLDVWNTNLDAGVIDVSVRPTRNWIKTDVSRVTLNPPHDPNGPFEKQSVRITIDRSQLSKGEHTGEIEFTARNVVSRTVSIRVVSDQDNNNNPPLNLVNVETSYRAPYLLEFSFALRDGQSNAVVAQPSQFQISAMEGNSPATFETGLHIRRAAARQLKAELLLDYSLTMQSENGAIDAMEDAAIDVFLPALNDDALVGVTEFHEENRDAQRVAEFTTNREFLAQRINGIQNQYVQGFASFARIYDSIVQVAKYFDGGNGEKEDRYIVLFSDGSDTSSVATANQAIRACTERNIKIYTVGIGQNVDEAGLIDLATRTGGLYFPSTTAADLADAFERVINDLEAQYTVRWASGKRGNANAFRPEFTLRLGNASVTHRSNAEFRPDSVAGNPLRGELFLVGSDNPENKTVFLRAEYVPRNIREFRFDIAATQAFEVARVETAQDGLVGTWNMTVTNTGPTSKRVVLHSDNNTPLPFAAFGPMLRLNFQEVIDPGALPITSLVVDDAPYINGQFFVVEGY